MTAGRTLLSDSVPGSGRTRPGQGPTLQGGAAVERVG